MTVTASAAFAMGRRPPATPNAPYAAGEETASLIRGLIENQSTSGISLEQPALVREFYARRNYQPAWVGNLAAGIRRERATSILKSADDDGLNPQWYRAGSLGLYTETGSSLDAAKYDISLSDAVLRYAHDLRFGRIAPDAVYADIDLPRSAFDLPGGLNDALANDTLAPFLAELAPADLEYRGLKAGLARYRSLAAQGGWPTLPASHTIDANSPAAELLLLRQRLAVEYSGVAAAFAAEDFDATAAIRMYQTRSGLEADGRAGTKTLAMLNVSASERAAQIAANLERRRWLPRPLEARRVEINVPDASLEFIVDGNVAVASKVIVGKPTNPTPIFRASVTAVTANPNWNVPSSIAAKEMLPKLQRDHGYLEANHIVLLNGPPDDPFGKSVNWQAVSADHFPFWLRQLPGSDNALGTVKLEMPNRFHVYLHDTPAQSLFAQFARYFSHGCIRVEQIVPLASAILAQDEANAGSDLAGAVAAAETKEFKLEHPVAIYALYQTAIPRSDATIDFRTDVYGRDERLIAALSDGRFVVGSLSPKETECSGSYKAG